MESPDEFTIIRPYRTNKQAVPERDFIVTELEGHPQLWLIKSVPLPHLSEGISIAEVEGRKPTGRVWGGENARPQDQVTLKPDSTTGNFTQRWILRPVPM